MPLISSANIACGFHAGSPALMARTVDLAIRHGVAIGAHPSFDDRANFGRTEMTLDPQEVFDLVLYQCGALKALCEARGAALHHVKPHGALYNQAARDPALAAAIAAAVKALGPSLKLYGLAGGQLLVAAEKAGLEAVSEVFADRRYQGDGSLVPRSQAGAVLEDDAEVQAQVLALAMDGEVQAQGGGKIQVKADSLCLHGDNQHALSLARTLRQALLERQIVIEAP
ncbi:LamB/YcsF family protein [Gallaecimonas kandeliae]|uniref:5-oxoprolinase subunit PxpA n=1 Tax=Gallaecimonas kandeliae TaxID=3029055 RepID=UPI002649EEDB|nr:5-oxoprolinase subunit PxpA [Gallaecimonas kandeliae]WKE67480.1 LamB/YcsF family protein [Gallaecimonas kandeliae]